VPHHPLAYVLVVNDAASEQSSITVEFRPFAFPSLPSNMLCERVTGSNAATISFALLIETELIGLGRIHV
jgi:hypothetical protein